VSGGGVHGTADNSYVNDTYSFLCVGGWDWAPYVRAGDDRGSRVFSFGVFKPVYIVKERAVSIIHVVPKIYYLGPYARYVYASLYTKMTTRKLVSYLVSLLMTQEANVTGTGG
jgi:hypothetical protein